MERFSDIIAPGQIRSIKVLQLGEGNFLRAFVDYMLDIAHECVHFDGDIVIVTHPLWITGPLT